MRVLEATGNTVEAIRKAWELRHDLTDPENSRNYSLSAGSRTIDSGYSGEFKVSLTGSSNQEDGTPRSLSLSVRNGLYGSNCSYAGRILLAGQFITNSPLYTQTIYSDQYNLSSLHLWHRIDCGSTFQCAYELKDTNEMPKGRENYYASIYTLLAVIREGRLYQAHYGPIIITDRYYDETVTQ